MMNHASSWGVSIVNIWVICGRSGGRSGGRSVTDAFDVDVDKNLGIAFKKGNCLFLPCDLVLKWCFEVRLAFSVSTNALTPKYNK
jgi:hypothetical protein